MFRLFPLILIIEIFCLYHAYKNRADQKWFWFIIIFPLIGCIFYLYHHFYSKDNIHIVTESVKGAVNRNYEVEKLEKEVQFSSTIQNKTNLADKYAADGRTAEAIELYESCLVGFNSNDLGVKMSLLECYASIREYEKACEIGDTFTSEKAFSNSWSRIGYAWSLYHVGRIEDAETNFKDTNVRYSNYPHRLEFAKFLALIEKKEEAIQLLDKMIDEFNNMNSSERRQISADRKAIIDYRASL
ncbi:MAG: hypothetical protein AB8B56_03965 [Crocinitomicaceae bacterium]